MEGLAVMIKQRRKTRESDDFFALVRAFPLKPIRTAKEHEAAGKVLVRLVGSKPEGSLSSGERDYIEALTILVRDYQEKRQDSRRAEMEPREILRHLVQENGMTVSDLGRVIGSRTAASMILNGRREPSKAQIVCLAERFGVEPSLFLGRWRK